jgi:sphingosine kinase
MSFVRVCCALLLRLLLLTMELSESMAEMNRPLLSTAAPTSGTSTTNSSAAWPVEAASRLKLLVPEEYATEAVYCRLQYEAARGVLLVLAADDEQVLDVIDVADMIGADISINEQSSTTTTSRAPSAGRATNEPPSDQLVDRQGSAVLTVYSYPRRNPAHGSWIKRWCGLKASSRPPPNPPTYDRASLDPSKLKERIAHHRRFLLAPSEDLRDANLMLQALRQLATGDASERSFLVIVNPVSGPRKDAAKVYEQSVRPMLAQAHITTEVLLTTHADHGRERMAAAPEVSSGDKDVIEYDGVVVMGGDGVIYEVVNGIMDRADAAAVLQKIKLGVVGCGTSNGLAASLAKHTKEMDNIMTSIFMIAKGQTLAIDVSKHQTRNTTQYSFLTYEYAMVADIDIESEAIRWLGSLRFDLWGVLSVLRMRRYRARFTYLPASKVPNHKTQGVAVMPASVDETIPAQDWVTIEDDFFIFWPSHLSHAACRTHQSPNSQIQDGLFQVFMVRGSAISRLRMALILIGMETGAHVQYPQAEFIDCCAYRLEPIAPVGISVLDGEVIEEGPIQANVLPASLTVFCHASF